MWNTAVNILSIAALHTPLDLDLSEYTSDVHICHSLYLLHRASNYLFILVPLVLLGRWWYNSDSQNMHDEITKYLISFKQNSEKC